jgi:uncharacterized membrane protein (DUF373 family)
MRMNMQQLLATILFFIVFIQLFLALSLYLGVTLYAYFKKGQERSHEKTPTQKEKTP